MHGRKTRFWMQIVSAVFLFSAVFINIRLFLRVQRVNRDLLKTEVLAPADSTNAAESSEALIEDILSRMTPEEKIGQLVVVNYYGRNWDQLSGLITNYYIGGIMLKSENIQGLSYEELKKNNRRLIGYSREIPLFLSIDQEGGDVARLGSLVRTYPSPAELYRKRGESGVVEQANYFGEKLDDLGIRINFSPVIDLISNSNSIVSGRSYTWDIDTNARLANRYIEIFARHGVIAVPKHFPGYGTVHNDPHYQVCRDDRSTLEALAAPFDRLESPDMIMTAHVILSKNDNRPATLSRSAIDYLRNRNKDTVIITDDIQMDAITELYDYKLAALDAFRAGCDIVLSITKDDVKWYTNAVELVEYLNAAYNNGEITDEALDRSVARILRLKLRYLQDEQWGVLQNDEREMIGRLFTVRSGG